MPLYDLSFTQEFFIGDCDLDDIEPSNRPTSVYQAALSLDHDKAVEIGREVFGQDGPTAERWADSDMMMSDILEKVKETDRCEGLETPVTVRIDEDGWYTLDVY